MQRIRAMSVCQKQDLHSLDHWPRERFLLVVDWLALDLDMDSYQDLLPGSGIGSLALDRYQIPVHQPDLVRV
jgi:hypothetical protein